MSHDLLRRASQALRATTDGATDRAQETRARLLTNAQLRRRSRNRWRVVWVPLAAALAVSSAWAGATGRLSASWHQLQGFAHPMASARSDVGAATHSVARILASSAPASRDEPLPRPVDSPVTESAAEFPQPAAIASSASSSHSLREDAGDADHAAYLVAHRAHFNGGSSSSALSAWNEYLRVFPAGRFSLEARYNRALCLVKLGRNVEASQALDPFARGAYGTYRQVEAKALREAIGAK
jgi:hypothetical protein